MLDNEIKGIVYEGFLNELSIEKIIELSSLLKQHDKRGNVPHKKFIDDLFEVFGHKKNKFYNNLYELIFSRFKIVTCSLINEKEKYYMTKMSSEEEINAYDLCLALAIFVKCNFKAKIKLIFDLSDMDEDGYINEKEIVTMITTLNLNFTEEETPIRTNSTILNQSLINIKTSQAINFLFYHPGQLKSILIQEKYVNFDTFYNELVKIPGYKFKIVPCYINFKECLYNTRKESEIKIKNQCRSDFVDVSNEIIFPLSLNYSLNRKNKNYSTSMKNIFIRKKLLPDNSKIKNKAKKRKMYLNNEMGQETLYDVNYSNILNVEVQPALVEFSGIKNNSNNIKLPLLSSQKSIVSRNRKNLYQHSNSLKNIIETKKSSINANNKNGYMTYGEILKEIKYLSNKNNKDEGTEQELELLGNMCRDEARFMRKSLIDKSEGGTKLFFGKNTIIKYK